MDLNALLAFIAMFIVILLVLVSIAYYGIKERDYEEEMILKKLQDTNKTLTHSKKSTNLNKKRLSTASTNKTTLLTTLLSTINIINNITINIIIIIIIIILIIIIIITNITIINCTTNRSKFFL